ncbi:tetratricopeptide repeat protein [Minwuia thermotolerans]|uniref:Uncharacterized protein n=1 Tax=Minwuia thermotolerans TaxID=2056226 RepID=A0A2M9FXV4_9PROT|nr:tetratricopeptide repeat protein [Minwuia thermotolerans]PJK28295.1 hypothetical protein CVT23_18150 [Minwuia thermotolerans]
MSFGFLHIGKTGGNAVLEHIGPLAAAHNVDFRRFGHDVRLREALAADPELKMSFVVRDPAARFVSAFWSRLRNGRPKRNSLWSPEEAVAFRWFATPDELACALEAEDERLKSAALFAMNAISHLRRNFAWALGSPEYLERVRHRLFFVAGLDELDQRLPEMAGRMALPRSGLPNEPAHVHVRPEGPSSADELSERGRANLRRFWVQDFEIYDYVVIQFSRFGGQELRRRHDQMRDEAMVLYRQGDYKAAVEALGPVLKRDPGNRTLKLVMARSLVNAGLVDRAEELWRDIARTEPDSAEPLAQLGQLSYARRNYAAALEWFRAALAADPANENARLRAIRSASLIEDQAIAVELVNQGGRGPEEMAETAHWETMVQIYLGMDDPISAERLLRARMAKFPKEAGRVRGHLASVLAHLHRVAEIEELGLKVSAVTDFMTMLALVRAAIRERNVRKARNRLKRLQEIAPGHSAVAEEADRVERLAGDLAASSRTPEPEARVVSLLGISFCGSTFLGSVLGSLPGVEHVGESHRLTKSIAMGEGGQQEVPFDFASDPRSMLTPCAHCGPECRVFDFDFRAALADDPTNWFQRLAARLGSEILVSGDKHMAPTLDPLERYDGVVLFKSPVNAYRSMRKREESNPDNPAYAYSGIRFGRSYATNYFRFLNLGKPQGRLLCLRWENFTAREEEHLERLCQLLDLPFDAGALKDRKAEQHFFGGNGEVRKQFAARPEKTNLVREKTQEIEIAESGKVAGHPAASAAFEALMARYEADFGDIAAAEAPKAAAKVTRGKGRVGGRGKAR